MQEEIRLIERDGSAKGQVGVRFWLTPELSEARTVNYQEISEMRQAGGLLIYIGTPARTYTLNVRMVSRTPREATDTFRTTHILKGWTVPMKENSGGGISGGSGENAPEVVKLYGYGQERQIRGVPVVITSLSIDYPNNVSYIQTTDKKAWVPIMQTFSISLKEARSPDELEKFSMEQYKLGVLPNW